MKIKDYLIVAGLILALSILALLIIGFFIGIPIYLFLTGNIFIGCVLSSVYLIVFFEILFGSKEEYVEFEVGDVLKYLEEDARTWQGKDYVIVKSIGESEGKKILEFEDGTWEYAYKANHNYYKVGRK